jgi:aminoglycoside phosphotransferase (APT) family kinase protein
VVCHNDLSPKNTVYRDSGSGLRPVAFIDWDIAAPGARIHDVAFVCWQYIGLGPSLADVAVAGQRMQLICSAYGLPDRSQLIDTILWWQDRCWRGIEAKAAAGEPAMIRLRDSGVVDLVRDAADWVTENRAELGAQLG